MRKTSVLLLAMGVLFAGCIDGGDRASGVEYNGLEYEPPLEVPDFTLTDQNGDNVSLSDFEGKVVVVAFTYTYCPDVCLVIEENLNFVKAQLGDGASEVVFLSISTDPARDTPAHLLEWTTQRGYDWPHLTSDNHTLLQETWDSWGIFVSNDNLDDGNHSDEGTEEDHSGDGTEEDHSGDGTEEDHSGDGTEEDHSGDGSNEDSTQDGAEANYSVGHNTRTFILDRGGDKKVYHVGIDWSTAEFLEDIQTLVAQ